MKDFKSYANSGGAAQGANGQNQSYGNAERQSYTGQTGNKNSGGENLNQTNGADLNQTVNMATMLAKAFNGKSEGQILQTILAQAEQGKRDGTLTNADLDNFYNALAPVLDGFKRKKLQNIIARLKSI